MARRSEVVSRGREGGPPAVWSVVAKVLLVVVLVNLVGRAFGGGHFWIGPWFFLPFFFLFWTVGGPWGRRRRGRYADRYEDSELDADRRDEMPPDGGRVAALEESLAGAQRQIRELQEQLRWQARLLEAGQQPAQQATQPPAARTPQAPPPDAAPPV
jgi:hypothetical protein